MIEKLKNIDKETYNSLKNSGMFWELHPEATGSWAVDSGFIRSSHDWLKDADFQHIKILNYSGWDRHNFEESMAQLITRQEFNSKIAASTIQFNLGELVSEKQQDVGLVEFTD